MNRSRLEAIIVQVYDLTRDLAAGEAETWDDVLHIHGAIAQGFGAAVGKAYASCSVDEAQIYTSNLTSIVLKCAQLGYETSQTQVASWRLDQIAKEAANGPRD